MSHVSPDVVKLLPLHWKFSLWGSGTHLAPPETIYVLNNCGRGGGGVPVVSLPASRTEDSVMCVSWMVFHTVTGGLVSELLASPVLQITSGSSLCGIISSFSLGWREIDSPGKELRWRRAATELTWGTWPAHRPKPWQDIYVRDSGR